VGDNPRSVEFDRIEGLTGQALRETDLQSLLESVSRIHACTVPGLEPFDPFLRIRPRLTATSSHLIRAVLRDPVPDGSATLHGDLHVGQFIRDGQGKVWIVDLDDLALGPPEADLANFAAHLATSGPGSISLCSQRVVTAWTGLGQACNDDIFQSYLRFSLVRRHLKLREAGRPDHEAMVLGYLRDSPNFSMR